jgi:hypothetical protein
VITDGGVHDRADPADLKQKERDACGIRIGCAWGANVASAAVRISKAIHSATNHGHDWRVPWNKMAMSGARNDERITPLELTKPPRK